MIDLYKFEKQFKAFKSFVEEQIDIEFVSFAHPYTQSEEGYKDEVYKEAREALGLSKWKADDVGSGKILSAVKNAIELKNNNLVPWQARYGEASRPHFKMYEALEDAHLQKELESAFFKLYHTHDDEESFQTLVNIFGKKYSLLAYLFFIKDNTRYLPISTTAFDNAFNMLGSEHKTGGRCGWDNYSEYLSTIKEVKGLLQTKLSSEVALLNAHSFVWMLILVLEKKGLSEDISDYQELTPKEKEAVVKARIGQGQYRKDLIRYWGKCAVTGCSQKSLLIASHIKPWKDSDLNECRDPYNGLLLSPTLDACFDQGSITFDDSGKIVFSSEFCQEDRLRLALSSEMKLTQIEGQHRGYLKYHRAEIFKD